MEAGFKNELGQVHEFKGGALHSGITSISSFSKFLGNPLMSVSFEASSERERYIPIALSG